MGILGEFYSPGNPGRFIEVSDARNLKALEDENAKLKRLLAEQVLDNAMLKGPPCLAGIGPRPMDVASRKW